MPKAAVAVADTLERTMQDVHARASEAFQQDLLTYRAGVREMAEAGGTLPEDRASEIVSVCQRLQISATRLADDATAFIRLANITARITAVQERNAARRAPLPELQAVMEQIDEEALQIRRECAQRLQEAERKSTEARKAYEAVANLRDERIEQEQAELLELQNRYPHLFHAITADQLRRFLA